MSALQYGVVVLPKLDSEEEIQRIREEYDPWYYQISPYIPMVEPFTPATLGEMENVSDYISLARRGFHPFAVSFRACVEADDRLLLPLENGREELIVLRRNLVGPGTAEAMAGAEYEPRLVIGRVPDPLRRSEALVEVARIGRILGVVDSVSLIEVAPNREMKLVANFPFGIGRVDYFDRLRA